MWRTIDSSVLKSKTKEEENQSCPAGSISPEEQDFASPAQQGKTLQIEKSPNLSDQPFNLADSKNNNNGVDVVSQTPKDKWDGSVAGYSSEQIREHIAKFPEGSWVWQNATADALRREGFVRHVMSLEPPKRPLKMVDGKPLPSYRQESGKRTVLTSDI